MPCFSVRSCCKVLARRESRGNFHLVKNSGNFGSSENGSHFLGPHHWKIQGKQECSGNLPESKQIILHFSSKSRFPECFFFSKMECYGLLFLLTLWHNLSCGEKEHDCRIIPSSFMLSIMVISLFNLAIDSCSFPLDRKSLLKPGIIP